MDPQAAIDARIRAVFQRQFGAEPGSIDDDTRRGVLESWDSLGHLELLAALHAEFGIEIPPEQALEMETVADVTRIVGQLLAASRVPAG